MRLIDRDAATAIDAVSRMYGADSAEAAEVQRRIAALVADEALRRREWTGEPEREEMER